MLGLILGEVVDLFVKLLEFFLGSVAHLSCNLALHLLDLEVRVVQQFLLPVLLQLEFGQVRL